MSPDRVLLSAADLDAYLPERATTNAFARPRLELKQRLLAWARRAAERLARDGLELEHHASDEHPSLRNQWRVTAQWLCFWSGSEERAHLERLLEQKRRLAEAVSDASPERRRAVLAVRVDAGGISVGLTLHPDAELDVDNLRARLADAPLAAPLTEALGRLPEQFTAGLDEGPQRPCEGLGAAELRALLDASKTQQAALWIGWRVPRELALAHAEELEERLEDALAAVAPLYRLVAWAKDNDHVGLDARLHALRAERAHHHAEAEAATTRWRAERDAETRQRHLVTAAPSPTLGTLFAPRGEASPRPRSEARGPVPPLPSPPRGAELEPRSNGESIEKGARVLAMKGPFAEKVGVVAELVGRGSARVLFGLLSARMELSDLRHAQEGRERPSLHSSHRRPLSTGPRRAR